MSKKEYDDVAKTRRDYLKAKKKASASSAQVGIQVGQAIAGARANAGLSVDDMTDALGLSPTVYRSFEDGGGAHILSITTLYRIAERLGVPARDLLP